MTEVEFQLKELKSQKFQNGKRELEVEVKRVDDKDMSIEDIEDLLPDVGEE